MHDVAITRISTRGQIVIPKKIRDKIELKPGDHFMIFGYEDTIILKKIKIYDLKKEFKETAKKIRKKAIELGITEEIVQEEIAKYRNEKRKKWKKGLKKILIGQRKEKTLKYIENYVMSREKKWYQKKINWRLLN